jgi:outer membrane lipoprotein LolB
LTGLPGRQAVQRRRGAAAALQALATRAATLGSAALVLLAGCAGAPPTATGADRLSGRLSVRIDGQPERSISAGFELSGHAQAGELLLTTPLGTTAARAQWQPGDARLRAGADEQRFETLDALVAAALGEPVPLPALFEWLRGRPWPGAASQPLPGGASGFVQLGWQIDLARWDQGWVQAQRSAPPVVTVRARLDRAE